MVFATFQGELVDINPASTLGAPVTAMLTSALCSQLISVAMIIRGYIALPNSIIPWVSAVLAMNLGALVLSMVMIVSSSAVDPLYLWLEYLLYLNAAMGSSLCELQLFKIFTIVTPDLKARDVTCVQIAVVSFFTLGMAGHYANVFNNGDEPEWLANVHAIDIVANMGHICEWRSCVRYQSPYKSEDISFHYQIPTA